MNKPSRICYKGKTTWAATRPECVEYVTWSFKGYTTSEALLAEMSSQFQMVFSASALSNITGALIRAGKLVSPKRGVFIHVEHVDHKGIFS